MSYLVYLNLIFLVLSTYFLATAKDRLETVIWSLAVFFNGGAVAVALHEVLPIF